MDQATVFEIVRAFVPDVQLVSETPNGIVIHPSKVAGWNPIGGGWRVQRGSGIAGRDGFWTVVSIAARPEGKPATLGPYTNKKKELLDMLKRCPGIVCRSCRGTYKKDEYPGGLWADPTPCSFCNLSGIPSLEKT